MIASEQGSTKRIPLSSSLATLPPLVLALVMLVGGVAVAAQPSNNDNKKKLTQLQSRITSLQLALDQDNKNKDIALNQLKDSEKAISKISAKLINLDKNISETREKLSRLQSQQHTLDQQVEQHKTFLTRQIRASYVIGKQEYIKLLLNQQNPATVSRIATYYQYFTKARVNRINDVTDDIALLRKTQNEIDIHRETLQKMRQQVSDNKSSLETQFIQRKDIVAKLSSRVQKKGDALKILLRDEEHLKRLLQQLTNDVSDVDNDLTQHKDFKTLKGRLPWPTAGTITAKFGTTRLSGQLKWKGVLIDTQPGKAIHAIAHGRVVFADWLRGFGMLIIINHGKGYMSLYGHNESLHKNLGDWVNAGEVIAAAGTSGGQKSSSLYFEIRHNGKPQNPKWWCKAVPN